MDLEELDRKIDQLAIRKQLRILLRTLSEAKNRLEICNLLWERALAAEDLLVADELELFNSAADTLIEIREVVGCRQQT